MKEYDEGNNDKWLDVYVGFGAPVALDSGTPAADPAYTAALGYGAVDTGQPDAIVTCAGRADPTLRRDPDNRVGYRFDHLQPGRFYHLDVVLYECDNSNRIERVLVDDMLVGGPVDLGDQAEHRLSHPARPGALPRSRDRRRGDRRGRQPARGGGRLGRAARDRLPLRGQRRGQRSRLHAGTRLGLSGRRGLPRLAALPERARGSDRQRSALPLRPARSGQALSTASELLAGDRQSRCSNASAPTGWTPARRSTWWPAHRSRRRSACRPRPTRPTAA